MICHVVDEHDFEDAELHDRLAPAPADDRVPAEAMQDLKTAIRGIDGPPAGDHRRGWILHRRCSTGTGIVDWIVGHAGVGRQTAAQWAAQLMRQGVLRHVYDDRPFADDRGLYRIG